MAEQYKCMVSDGNVSKEACIYLIVDRGLTLEYEEDIAVNYGDTAIIKVEAENSMGNVSYQWLYMNEESEYIEIEGATENTYSVTADENAHEEYMCRVTNGRESREANIYVCVDSRLTVDYESDVAVKSGETAVLEVKAESPYGRNITYQWFYWDEEEDDYVRIEGAVGNTFSVRADENMSEVYTCTITDGIQCRYANFCSTIDVGFNHVLWRRT